MKEITTYYDNTPSGEHHENRSRATIMLEKIKRENRKKKFVRVPLPDGKGYREVEVEKYRRQQAKKTIKH